jgi:hypothetical protein
MPVSRLHLDERRGKGSANTDVPHLLCSSAVFSSGREGQTSTALQIAASDLAEMQCAFRKRLNCREE